MSDNYLRPRQSFNLAVGAASVSTGPAVPTPCTYVRIATNADCYVFYSSSGTAKVAVQGGSGMYLRASTAGETFKCSPGDIFSVIQTESPMVGVCNFSCMSG